MPSFQVLPLVRRYICYIGRMEEEGAMVTERELRTTAQRCARACEQHHSTRDLLGWAQGLAMRVIAVVRYRSAREASGSRLLAHPH